jgi:hypothetical protein
MMSTNYVVFHSNFMFIKLELFCLFSEILGKNSFLFIFIFGYFVYSQKIRNLRFTLSTLSGCLRWYNNLAFIFLIIQI